MTTIECPRCLADNEASQRFCGSCGAEVAASAASSSSEASSPVPSGSGGGLSSTQMADLPAFGPSATDLPGPDASPEISLVEGQGVANRYEIRRLIGVGGMGAVYAAHDRIRGKEIALKVLLPRLVSNDHARERFVNEGRVASELSHPGIVNVFDVHESEGLSFLTMELLEGRTLREEIEARAGSGAAFEIEEAVRIGKALCEALAYAHEFTVHRDVKPENIFLCSNGSVKLMDFGIARLLSTSQLTMTGMALGTAYYMAPEQLKGAAEVDGRADQYSVGVVLYELLTGEVPTGRARSAREVRKEVPAGLSSVVDRALEATPEKRFDGARDFGAALESDVKGEGRSRTMGRSSWWLAGLAAILFVFAAVGLLWESGARRVEQARNEPIRQAEVGNEAIRTVEVGNAPIWGPVEAPVTIVEFSDFQCPFCNRVTSTLDRIAKEYGGRVRVAFKHYPLSIHPQAPQAHAAAEAAHRQGRFWEMHDRIFENQRDLSVATLESYARALGLDMEKYAKDVADASVKKRIAEDMAQANELGVTGTPAFFINGRYLSGAQPFENFRRIIDEALASAGEG